MECSGGRRPSPTQDTAVKKPTPKSKMTMKQFEKSKYDKDPKGAKEGSKADKALDKKQLAAVNKRRK